MCKLHASNGIAGRCAVANTARGAGRNHAATPIPRVDVRACVCVCANFKKPPFHVCACTWKIYFHLPAFWLAPGINGAPAVCEIGIDLCRSNKSRKLADKFFICGAVIWVKNCDTPRDTSSNHYYYSRVFRMRRRRGCCCACERVNARAARQRWFVVVVPSIFAIKNTHSKRASERVCERGTELPRHSNMQNSGTEIHITPRPKLFSLLYAMCWLCAMALSWMNKAFYKYQPQQQRFVSAAYTQTESTTQHSAADNSALFRTFPPSKLRCVPIPTSLLRAWLKIERRADFDCCCW